jgi:hypothetical protein
MEAPVSFLHRIASRAVPTVYRTPALNPKGRTGSRPPLPARAVRRAQEEPDEMPEEEPTATASRLPAPPVARLADDEVEEDREGRVPRQIEAKDNESESDIADAVSAQPLRRQAVEEDEPEGTATRPLLRATEEEEAPATRARRTAAPPPADEEEPVAARRLLGRADEEGPEVQPARALTEDDMSPESAVLPDEMAGEEEPRDVRALRRSAEGSPLPTGQPAAPVTAAADSRGAPAEPIPPWYPAEERAAQSAYPAAPPTSAGSVIPAPATASLGAERPQVLIDQIDVLIREPAAPAPAAGHTPDTGRSLRARYLRRL